MKRKLMFSVKSGKFRFMNNNIKKLILISVFLFFSISVWSQEGTRVKDFYSPYFISGTSSVTDMLSPQSESINPAAGALTQRVTLDLSYLGLIGQDGSVEGYKGHGINIGNTIPTKAGVISWSGHFLSSPFPSISSDSTFSLNGSFSKDLFPDLLVGAGLKFAGSLEPGIAIMLDLGVLALEGTVGPFRHFNWGVVLQDLGYSGISTGYPDPFSLTGGVGANLLSSETFNIDATVDLGFIGITAFKSVIMTIGSKITFKDIITLNLGTRIDVDSLINGNAYGIIPSFGIIYSFKTNLDDGKNFLGFSERGWNKSEINIQSGVGIISQNLWVAGLGLNIPLGLIDKSAPVIKLDISGFETEKEVEEDSPVSFLPLDKNLLKTGLNKISLPISSVLVKTGKNSSSSLKTIQNESSKYTGKYDKKYPETGISYYISPNNDGISDELTFPISISDTRYLAGYAFLIKDSGDEIIREIRNKEKRIENEGFSSFFSRLFSVKSGIEIPTEFRWDGVDNNGSVVSDGLYFFSVEAWDDNGNKGSSDSYAIVLDTSVPELVISEPNEDEKIFSPNGDGNKDIINIFQSGSDEDLWIAYIKDSLGNTVKSFKWIDGVPDDINWDGLDDSNNMVPDGVYSYKIETTDRAGNSFTSEFSNIVKNTEETPITINIDKAYFSPNNDMILDSLILTPENPVTGGIISWSVYINDNKGIHRRSFVGEKSVPESIIFDGRDSDGIRLEEGSYSATIEVLYQNGNHPDAVSPMFNIDISPPVASLKSSSSVFSPNGDGLKDEISFYQETSVELNWSGIIKSKEGMIINEYQWLSAAEPTVSWNGTSKDGHLAPDGDYTYQLIAIDKAGNAGQSDIVGFSLNTEETPVILTIDLEYFSPNGDSVKDNISIIPDLRLKEGIAQYSLDILDAESAVVRKFSGKNNMPDIFLWNGIRSDGRKAIDGVYTANLSITYKKGDSPKASTPEFTIDTKFPDTESITEYTLFSPDSDGNNDSVLIKNTTSDEDLWQADISSASGEIVKTFHWKGKAENFDWNGTDDEGNLVPDGMFSYRIYSEDKAGNYSISEIKNIEVDKKPTSIFVTVSDKYLSPTGNGLYEDLIFTTIVNNKNGLESWSLKILRENGRLEKEFSGDSGIPRYIKWNGLNESGKIVEGNYTALFSAKYTKGNKPEAKSSNFLLDISAPLGSIDISPLPFSPDNDGVDDEVSIKMIVRDASQIKKWYLEIKDPENRAFKVFSGEGLPSDKIIWDGTSSSGELVYAAMDYSVELLLEDILGNTSIYNDNIPVDVLVVREGDVLKIKIANIIFKRNSPELLADTPKVIAQNKFILNRVSELLKKYNTYRITVEGHAVLTRWNNPAAAKVEEETELGPLSEQRADTVLTYLTKLGVPSSRMDSEGKGGKEPLVPHSDLENRWKNRRVEFILWKE
jgi:outer membrane protein OmpA-like peptidoglycan-associated protein/flagellar hook assembly protein FlgD